MTFIIYLLLISNFGFFVQSKSFYNINQLRNIPDDMETLMNSPGDVVITNPQTNKDDVIELTNENIEDLVMKPIINQDDTVDPMNTQDVEKPLDNDEKDNQDQVSNEIIAQNDEDIESNSGDESINENEKEDESNLVDETNNESDLANETNNESDLTNETNNEEQDTEEEDNESNSDEETSNQEEAEFIEIVPPIDSGLPNKKAVILGGYGPGYTALADVDVVTKNKVCSESIGPVPNKIGRFLGDVSGMAEYIGNGIILYCRDISCWKLDLNNEPIWSEISGFSTHRKRVASVSVNGTMVVLSNLKDDQDGLAVEIYNQITDEWELKPNLQLEKGRKSFCTVPVNETAILLIGGYTHYGPTDSVELLDLQSGNRMEFESLPTPRYGQSCSVMDWADQKGIIVAGGALTGHDVQFLDLTNQTWIELPSLPYEVDGHKMAMIEGVPTIFSWQRALQFVSNEWIDADLELSHGRSAFAVTSVPGNLISDC